MNSPKSRTSSNASPPAAPEGGPSSGKGLAWWKWLLFAAAVVAGAIFGWWWRTRVPQPPVAIPSGGEVVEPADDEDAHPLDPALDLARDGLQQIQAEIRDYTATLTKRERIGAKLVEQKMFIKVRQRDRENDQLNVPMSVYLKFLEPPSVAGREVIWVEDRNDGKLVAHEGGIKNLLRVNLAPKSMLAMMGNRYPITEIGIENLIVKLIERGERDKQTGSCDVQFLEDQTHGDRTCRVIQVTHPERRPEFDFFRAQIWIDVERNIPLRYSALVWPESEGDEPVLDEEYVYEDVKLNVGLTEKDFDPDNANYEFP
jgi:hypothetical protein